jgi:chloride channel
MSMESIIDKNYTAVNPEMPLGKLVYVISRSHTSFIPVLDHAGQLIGEIDVTKIRHIMSRTELYHKFSAAQIMCPPPAVLGRNDPMEEVMNKFDKTDATYLPVVDANNELQGFISRTRMYAMYRKMVADFSTE